MQDKNKEFKMIFRCKMNEVYQNGNVTILLIYNLFIFYFHEMKTHPTYF